MSWFKRFWPSSQTNGSLRWNRQMPTPVGGFGNEEDVDGMRFWHGPQGAVLSLRELPKRELFRLQADGEDATRRFAREFAQDQNGGLIEVKTGVGAGRAVQFIYKQRMPHYMYTGMCMMPWEEAAAVWTIAACEVGSTGLREALVAGELMASGKLDVDGYRLWFARDPYDPCYGGVDRSVLLFMSDDEEYDSRFPNHPLSIVRRVLAELAT